MKPTQEQIEQAKEILISAGYLELVLWHRDDVEETLKDIKERHSDFPDFSREHIDNLIERIENCAQDQGYSFDIIRDLAYEYAKEELGWS